MQGVEWGTDPRALSYAGSLLYLDTCAEIPGHSDATAIRGPVCLLSQDRFEAELCADELVVGGGVGCSYNRRRRRRRRQIG